MGSSTGRIIASMVFSHIALILNVVCNGSPDWIFLQTNSTNATHTPVITKGLWDVCTDGACKPFDEGQQPAWLKASQILDTIGVGFGAVGLALAYLFICSDRFRGKSFPLNVVIIVILTLSCACIMSGVITFGVVSKLVDKPPTFGWTYYLAIGGAVLTAATVGLHIWLGQELLVKRAYMEIYE